MSKSEPPSSAAHEAQGARGEWDYRFEQEVRRELLRQGIEFDATLEQIVNATRRVLWRCVSF